MFCAILLTIASLAVAAPITAYIPGASTGSQAWAGNLGMDFDVSSSVNVSALGAFGPRSGFSQGTTISVGIFDRVTGSAVTPSLSFTGVSGIFDLASHSWFQALNVPVLLGPGGYSVVAVGYNSNDHNGNSGNITDPVGSTNGGGLLTFVGGSRYDGSGSLAFPGIIDGGPANRYYAGNFQFDAAAVPEPGTYAMMGLGLLGLAALRRRR